MIKRKLHFSVSQFLIAFVLVTCSFINVSHAQEAVETPSETEATAPPEAAATGDVAAGKSLFNSNCASCHKVYDKSVGPALHLVTDRHTTDWIYSWVKNSAAMIAAGDAEAVKIYEEYNQSNMNAFPQLSNADIDNIIAYVNQPKPEAAVIPPPTGGQASGGGDMMSNNLVLGILVLILLVLIAILFAVNSTLTRFAQANGIQTEFEKTERTPIWKAFVQNQFLVIVSAIFLLLASAYFVYGFFMSVGVDQGYTPIQPIHYSHKIHAGTNEIDCKYCHSSARESKHSGIPSLNVCMNCHKSINEYKGETTAEYSKAFYDGEIQKLYDAVGWDAANLEYTGDTKPVKWVRIHNLPDLAYFNHAQHVTAGNIECQTCHGPVEEMEIMYQYSPLTMGWCINCHRETNVDLANNGYYEKIHEELSKKRGGKKLTIADLGGLECGKCHY